MLLAGDMESNWSMLGVIRICLLPKRFCRSSTASREFDSVIKIPEIAAFAGHFGYDIK